MHELSITQSIIRISSDEAKKHNALKVKEIRIKVSELSGLIPDCIQYYFDIASKGTIVEGAVLKIDKIPIRVKCSDCLHEEALSSRNYACSKCGSSNIKITKTNEFLIESLEVE